MVRVLGTFAVGALLCASCTLVVDTSGLSGGATDAGSDGAGDGSREEPASDAGVDAGTDAARDADGSIVDAMTGDVFVPPAGSTTWPANGHAYRVFATNDPITWTDASNAAEQMGGHLATMTSAEENDFVFSVAATSDAAWLPVDSTLYGPWIGGRQAPGSTEPAGGWGWVTGEAFSYAGWDTDQPNNIGGNEDSLIFYQSTGGKGKHWADVNDAQPVKGYVVEFEPR